MDESVGDVVAWTADGCSVIDSVGVRLGSIDGNNVDNIDGVNEGFTDGNCVGFSVERYIPTDGLYDNGDDDEVCNTLEGLHEGE